MISQIGFAIDQHFHAGKRKSEVADDFRLFLEGKVVVSRYENYSLVRQLRQSCKTRFDVRIVALEREIARMYKHVSIGHRDARVSIMRIA